MENIDVTKATIGQWATYIDTGMWSWDQKTGACVAPDDLTIRQLKDFLLASGGAVYLAENEKLTWARVG